MPRSLLRDRNVEASMRIFGTGARKANISELGRILNISTSTLYYWQKHPEHMSLHSFSKIVQARNLRDDEILRIIRDIY